MGVTNQLFRAQAKGQSLVKEVQYIGEGLAQQGVSDELLQEVREVYKLFVEGSTRLTAIYQAHGGRV